MNGYSWTKFTRKLQGTAFAPSLLEDELPVPADSYSVDTVDSDIAEACFFVHDAAVPPSKLIVVDISLQKLGFMVGGSVVAEYSVSTSKYGIGCRHNTGCTPIGWHRISAKIGANEPLGTVFKGRRATGITASLQSSSAEDLITSRILWLTGLQGKFNRGGQVDSKNRYIYIHGTAQEHLLGTPVSVGCVRMANDDVLDLFNQVDAGTLVFIGQSL